MYGCINEFEPNFSSELGGEGGASTYSGLRIVKYAENNSFQMSVLLKVLTTLFSTVYLRKSRFRK